MSSRSNASPAGGASDVDVERLLDEIRERARRRDGSTTVPPPPSSGASPAVTADLAVLEDHADVYNVRFRSHRRLLGRFIVRLFDFFRLLLTPVLTRQSAFNASTGRVAASLREQIHQLSRDQAALREKIDETLRWRELLEEIESAASRKDTAADEGQGGAFDSLAFENRFRGAESAIRERQRPYLECFRECTDVLDVGCGRGEFLEVLREAGVSARGIDLEIDMVLHCREKGLDVSREDAFEHLSSLPDASLGGVFAAQVIEHFPPARVISLVRLCHEKLRPGGILVFETPNPACLAVFARSFYMDFTHTQPIHPDAMRFLLEATGFTGVEIRFSSPVDPGLDVPSDGMPGHLRRNFERLNELIYGFQDYAVIGRKE